MSLYRIQFDGEEDYVEAHSLSDASALWIETMKRENGEDFDDEPDGVALVSRNPVLRREASDG